MDTSILPSPLAGEGGFPPLICRGVWVGRVRGRVDSYVISRRLCNVQAIPESASIVIPAKAGIQSLFTRYLWIPD